MKIKTTKEIQYRKVKYRVDTEHELAFTPWVLRAAKKSHYFLHKRGLLQPVQSDLGLDVKKKSWMDKFKFVRWIKYSLINYKMPIKGR